MKDSANIEIESLDLDLEPVEFFGDVIQALIGELENSIGLEEASGYINLVGRRLGDKIGQSYTGKLGELPDHLPSVAAILVDLKRRIGGEFSVSDITDTKIEFTNSRCPFGDKVKGRESLCMMTTNVFGVIASRACGYAHVDIAESIAAGQPGCKVTVTIDDSAVETERGYEFYG